MEDKYLGDYDGVPCYEADSLLASTIDAYIQAAHETLFNSRPLFASFMPKWDLPPVTPKRRRQMRRRAWIHRAKSWRLKLINLEDSWHRREDCY